MKLEYIYKKPLFLMKCIYGIIFILLGNLAGNALQFGISVLRTHDPSFDATSKKSRGPVIGLAFAVVTACAILNIFSRKGAIFLNNCLAIAKGTMLVVIIILGINYRRQNGTCASSFKVQTGVTHFGDVVSSLIYAIYPFAGFEQPFYVMSEVSRPHKKFSWAVLISMVSIFIMYPLIHFSYFCVVDLNNYNGDRDIFTAFIQTLSNGSHAKQKTASAIIAIFIFGNIFVQTYTAARVKQEIAKEGILPFSLVFATEYTSPWAWLRNRSSRFKERFTIANLENHFEQVPISATLLHWLSYALSFAVTSFLDPHTAYNYLTYLHSYVIIVVLGALTSGGLVYLKLDSIIRGENGRNWAKKVAWKSWIDPVPAVVYTCISTFLVFVCFAPVHNFAHILPKYPWVVPIVGLSSVLWGVVWWLGLEFIQWKGRWRLEVERTPYLAPDEDGQYVQKAERISHKRSMADEPDGYDLT
jgi:amino acid transporter